MYESQQDVPGLAMTLVCDTMWMSQQVLKLGCCYQSPYDSDAWIGKWMDIGPKMRIMSVEYFNRQLVSFYRII